jgi:hypothetical protein
MYPQIWRIFYLTWSSEAERIHGYSLWNTVVLRKVLHYPQPVLQEMGKINMKSFEKGNNMGTVYWHKVNYTLCSPGDRGE